MKKLILFSFLACLNFSFGLLAEVSLSSLFTDHAVLQRDLPVKVWGWAEPSEKVSVTFVGETQTAVADGQGNWSVTFPAQKAGGPHVLVVKGNNEISRSDILFGEVWVCSGQSNMGFSVGGSRDGDLEALLCKDANLRLITVANPGAQEKHKDVQGAWALADAQTVPRFSAVGYYFGRELRRALNVPVGLINNAWGGSACEAWVPRDVLATDKRNERYVKAFAEKVAGFDEEKTMAAYDAKFEAWKKIANEARANKTEVPRPPRKPQDPRYGQHRPANLYNTRINPLLGYGIKGAIWYQGENNTNDDRSYGYRYLLPMMIQTWRKDWGVGDFSFYWSQLADFAASRDADGFSPWAEMRESMTVAMQTTPKTGQAVITDLGEDMDIHPRKKLEVAKRLVRWALVKDYGFKLEYSSPMYESHEIEGNKVTLKFSHAAGGLRTYDVRDVIGFTIAGADQKFVPAKAKLMGDKVQVWSDQIKDPVAVRYAWAGNPECNVYSKIDLPLTPFRTDDWKLGSQVD